MKHNVVKVIQHELIAQAGITPKQCIEWVRESFMMKYEAQLPAKISLRPQGDDFFNTMPCILPKRYNRYGVKVVHRIKGQTPLLGSDILLYDSSNGRLLALLNGDWITTMRTGAVAALAIKTLKAKGVTTYSFVGLGNTARATAMCLLADNADREVKFRLLRYKDQAEAFVDRFKTVPNAHFEIVDDIKELVAGAQVIVSCVTSANDLFCDDDALFRPGVLLVPVHTRGFQNCDLFFDKIYGDDTAHLHGFKYFARFKYFNELSRVLLGTDSGRDNDDQRIISYNIGLSLHDIVFAHHIYEALGQQAPSMQQVIEDKKFWV